MGVATTGRRQSWGKRWASVFICALVVLVPQVQPAGAEGTTPLTAPLEVSPPSPAYGQVGVPFEDDVEASGGLTPYTWSATDLPAGLSIEAQGNNFGFSGDTYVTGTPTQGGIFISTVTVKDSGGQQSEAQLTIEVDGSQMHLAETELKGGVDETTYSAEVQVDGGTPPFHYILDSPQDALPPGVQFDGADGTFSGTPLEAGAYWITLTITDSSPQPQTVPVEVEIIVTQPVVQTVVVQRTVYQIAVVKDEVPSPTLPLTYTLVPGSGTYETLPPGTKLNRRTGVITGRATSIGTYTVTVKETDSSKPGKQALVVLEIQVPSSAVATTTTTAQPHVTTTTRLRSPPTTTTTTSPARMKGERYVALGDSYSAGEGAGNYYPGTFGPSGDGCDRSRNAYPVLVAKHLGAPFNGEPGIEEPFAACSGATTVDLTEPFKKEAPQLHHLGPATKVVTISIGGNDAGFGPIVTFCLQNPRECVAKEGRVFDNNLEALAKKLPTVYSRVRTSAPNARVVAVPYPDFMPAGGTCNPTTMAIRTAAVLGRKNVTLPADAVVMMHKDILDLDAMIGADAKAAGFSVAQIDQGLWSSHNICGGSSWFVKVNLTAHLFNLDVTFFHPTAQGQKELAKEVIIALGKKE
jgi:lysophospholipase L1-like esterase